MKILYHHRIRSKDGQYVHVEELTTALKAHGHELIMVGPSHVDKAGFGADAGFVAHLKKLLPRALYEILELAYAVPACFRVLAAARKHKPDFIYERYNLLYPAGAVAKRILKLPLLLEINAPLFEERAKFDGIALKGLARWSERFVWRSADVALPVTEVLAKHVIAAGVPREKITVIHNGIDKEKFHCVESSDAAKARLKVGGKCVLGFVGFVRSWHGLDKVLAFLKSQGDRNLHLMVVGDGPARAELEKTAHELGIADQLTFTGIVERDAVASHINAFDIALQPAVVAYASPLKLFEYMAMGKAIIAPASANICEILTDGRDGLLFQPDNDQSFIDGLRKITSDAALRERLGKGAESTLIERGLTWEDNAKRVAALAKPLVAARSTVSS